MLTDVDFCMRGYTLYCEIEFTTISFKTGSSGLVICKVVMQGKLISVAYTLVHLETSSLWAGFVNKNRCTVFV